MPIQRCELPDGSGKGWKWGSSGTCYRDRADAEKQAQAAYANGYAGDALPMAQDKSVRTIDQDGHLHVSLSNISKANVCPYVGSEIPEADKLGLKPDRIYQLYRDPKALAKAAPTFNGKPLLIVHKPQNAAEHDHELVIGSVNNVEFNAPYLQAELVVWDGDAISLIQSGEQRELSCGYYYRCVMEPGSANGVPYDGYMTDIVGNHVAVVQQGRAGPDVFVGDAKPSLPETPAPPEQPKQLAASDQKAPHCNYEDIHAMPKASASLSRQGLLASGALRAYLLPKMAADAKIDLNPILKPVTGKNWKSQKPRIKAALDKALDGKLAKDADLEDLLGLLDALEDVPDPEPAADADPDDDDDDDEETKKKKAKEAAEKLKEAAADADKDDDDDDDGAMDADEDDDEEDKKRKAKEAAEKLKEAAKDRKGARDKAAKDKAKGMDAEPTVTKAAMDSAIAAAVSLATKKAAQDAEQSTIARLRAIAEAEKAVRPYIGELAVAQDSAAAVYRLALDAAGVDLTGVPEAAFPAMVKLLPKPGEQVQAAKPARVAQDAAVVSARAAMFPNANRLRTH